MTNALDQSILELLQASRDDEETIHLPVNDRTFGFHVQQAVEKLLKGLIAGNGKRFEYTHDIGTLIREAKALGESIPGPTEPLEALTGFAGIWRYQEPEALMPERRAALKETVLELRTYTLERLKTLRPNVDWANLRQS